MAHGLLKYLVFRGCGRMLTLWKNADMSLWRSWRSGWFLKLGTETPYPRLRVLALELKRSLLRRWGQFFKGKISFVSLGRLGILGLSQVENTNLWSKGVKKSAFQIPMLVISAPVWSRKYFVKQASHLRSGTTYRPQYYHCNWITSFSLLSQSSVLVSALSPYFCRKPWRASSKGLPPTSSDLPTEALAQTGALLQPITQWTQATQVTR